MISEKKKIVYYVLGTAALVTGIYVLANKEEVKRGFEWLKNTIKFKSKNKENDQ